MTNSTTRLRQLETELVGSYLRRRPLTAAQLGEPAWREQLLPVVAAQAEDDLAARITDIRARLTTAGALVGSSDHRVSKSLYAKDPSGVEFEVM